MQVRAGVAVVEITPPAGLAMAGFAARTRPAEGAHDALTVRALVIEDTAVLIADVIGIDADMSARIRARVPLAGDALVIAALHTHGGPVSMAGRVGPDADRAYLSRLEAACVAALETAWRSRVAATLAFGLAAGVDVGRNRRHAGGPVDKAIPVLEVRGPDGAAMAILISYACHPVVLDATNLLWTADYPHFVRQAVEEARPGAVCLFFTGCTGDVNTGHTAKASVSLASNPDRSFAAAELIGRRIAAAVRDTVCEPVAGKEVDFGARMVPLDLERREIGCSQDLVACWQKALETADAAHRPVFETWIEWARTRMTVPLEPLAARVTVLRWGEVLLIALPGEIFAQTALEIRGSGADRAFIVSYADDNPGYIPPRDEYVHGGYEVEEAHRYYGQPAGFAPGSAERLRDTALALISSIKAPA